MCGSSAMRQKDWHHLCGTKGWTALRNAFMVCSSCSTRFGEFCRRLNLNDKWNTFHLSRFPVCCLNQILNRAFVMIQNLSVTQMFPCYQGKMTHKCARVSFIKGSLNKIVTESRRKCLYSYCKPRYLWRKNIYTDKDDHRHALSLNCG